MQRRLHVYTSAGALTGVAHAQGVAQADGSSTASFWDDFGEWHAFAQGDGNSATQAPGDQADTFAYTLGHAEPGFAGTATDTGAHALQVRAPVPRQVALLTRG